MNNGIGSRLKQIREHIKLSQDKFAKLLGITQTTYSYYENGKRYPDSRTLEKIKEITNVNLNWLISGQTSVDDYCPDVPDNSEIRDFFKLFNNIPFVRHSILAHLVDLKFRHPEIFKDNKNSIDEKEETKINVR